MGATQGPAETQGPHESGLVLPDSLGLVTTIGACHQHASVVRGPTRYTETQVAGRGEGWGAVGRRASLSLGHRQPESRDTAPGDLHTAGSF